MENSGEGTSSSSSAIRTQSRRISRKMTNLEEEEDEEMEVEPAAGQQQPRKQRQIQGSEDEEEEEEEDEDEDTGSEEEEDEEEEDESEPEIPEMLVPNRSRRANAGRKMQELLNQQIEQGDKDEFYTKVYGGFQEMEQDADFQSPPHSSDEGEADDVDSDFDKDEEGEENEEMEQANRVEELERVEQRRKKLKQKQLLERNKNWAIARINKASVPENSCDPKTQRQRLEEAKKTAELNIASLKRFEEFELERKKRQAKVGPKNRLEGPRIREIMTAEGKHLLVLPELPPKEQLFPRPERREYRVCALTGKPARYMDPLTKLPYADAAAFHTIREKYKEYLAQAGVADKRGQQLNGKGGPPMSGNGARMMAQQSGSTAAFARQPTPAKQRKVMLGEDRTGPSSSSHGGSRIRVEDLQ